GAARPAVERHDGADHGEHENRRSEKNAGRAETCDVGLRGPHSGSTPVSPIGRPELLPQGKYLPPGRICQPPYPGWIRALLRIVCACGLLLVLYPQSANAISDPPQYSN